MPALTSSRRGSSVRTHPPDLDHGRLLLRAVVVDRTGLVKHVAACGHGHGALGIVFLTRADPPRARDHHEEAIVRVEVRTAHVAGKPPQSDHVRTGLLRIAKQHGRLLRASCVLHPLDVVRCGDLHALADDLLRRAKRRPEHHRADCESYRASRSSHGASPGARTISRFGQEFNPAARRLLDLLEQRPSPSA